MSAATQIRELKRVLAREADLQRELLQVELWRLSGRINGAEQTFDTIRTMSPWLTAGAAILGLFFGKRQGNNSNWLSAALSALECVQKLRLK